MTPSPPVSPNVARFPRRQSRLPPGWPVVLRGTDVAFDARIALGRVWQLYRIHVQAPTLPDGFRWRDAPMPVEVRELAEACGLILGPAPNRVVVACPTCDHEGSLLHLTWGAWRCHACDRRRWSQLDQSLATYAHGLMVGLTGRPMVWRRERLLRALTRLPVTPALAAVLATSPFAERLAPIDMRTARELGRADRSY